MMARVLVVDDDALLRETLQLGLAKRGYAAQACQDPDAALAALRSEDFDVIVTDLSMRGATGIELCRTLAESQRDLPVIVLTAFGSYETAVAAMRAGAHDFISKPVQLDVLAMAIARAAQHRALHREVTRL